MVAFNKRAADEMKERTLDLPELQVRTLNALGLSLVARSEQATTIEEREVRTILDSLVDLPRRANVDAAAAWIEALSAVRLGLRAPAKVEREFGGDVDGLPGVFERYRRLLTERRLVDFDEQVYRAIEILLTEPRLVGEPAARAGFSSLTSSKTSRRHTSFSSACSPVLTGPCSELGTMIKRSTATREPRRSG